MLPEAIGGCEGESEGLSLLREIGTSIGSHERGYQSGYGRSELCRVAERTSGSVQSGWSRRQPARHFTSSIRHPLIGSLLQMAGMIDRGVLHHVSFYSFSFSVRRYPMRFLTIPTALVAMTIGTAFSSSTNPARSGCNCIDCKCPDCSGGVCTCDVCKCGTCGCNTYATTAAVAVPALARACCKFPQAAVASACQCENCACPDCNGQTCSCEVCACGSCGCLN